MMFSLLQADEARFALCTRTLCAMRTGRTVLTCKTRLPDDAVLFIRILMPREALFTGRTSNDTLLPIYLELRFIKPGLGTSLPTRIVSYWADDRYVMFLLAFDQHLGVGVAFIHEMFGRQ